MQQDNKDRSDFCLMLNVPWTAHDGMYVKYNITPDYSIHIIVVFETGNFNFFALVSQFLICTPFLFIFCYFVEANIVSQWIVTSRRLTLVTRSMVWYVL